MNVSCVMKGGVVGGPGSSEAFETSQATYPLVPNRTASPLAGANPRMVGAGLPALATVLRVPGFLAVMISLV